MDDPTTIIKSLSELTASGALVWLVWFIIARLFPQYRADLISQTTLEREAHALETLALRGDCHQRIAELRADVQALIKEIDKP
jgi:hypothetical protein